MRCGESSVRPQQEEHCTQKLVRDGYWGPAPTLVVHEDSHDRRNVRALCIVKTYETYNSLLRRIKFTQSSKSVMGECSLIPKDKGITSESQAEQKVFARRRITISNVSLRNLTSRLLSLTRLGRPLTPAVSTTVATNFSCERSDGDLALTTAIVFTMA